MINHSDRRLSRPGAAAACRDSVEITRPDGTRSTVAERIGWVRPDASERQRSDGSIETAKNIVLAAKAVEGRTRRIPGTRRSRSRISDGGLRDVSWRSVAPSMNL